MSTRKIKDAKDLNTNELIYFKSHAKATYMSDGSTVEDAINAIGNSGNNLLSFYGFVDIIGDTLLDRDTELTEELNDYKICYDKNWDIFIYFKDSDSTSYTQFPNWRSYSYEYSPNQIFINESTDIKFKYDKQGQFTYLYDIREIGDSNLLPFDELIVDIIREAGGDSTQIPIHLILDYAITDKSEKILYGFVPDMSTLNTHEPKSIGISLLRNNDNYELYHSTYDNASRITITTPFNIYILEHDSEDNTFIQSQKIPTCLTDTSFSSYNEVHHDVFDTTVSLTPNTFHIWDEVTELTLTFGEEIAGMANEYIFQFESGSEPTMLILPDSVKFNSDFIIEANKIYQISILNGLGTVISWDI